MEKLVIIGTVENKIIAKMMKKNKANKKNVLEGLYIVEGEMYCSDGRSMIVLSKEKWSINGDAVEGKKYEIHSAKKNSLGCEYIVSVTEQQAPNFKSCIPDVSTYKKINNDYIIDTDCKATSLIISMFEHSGVVVSYEMIEPLAHNYGFINCAYVYSRDRAVVIVFSGTVKYICIPMKHENTVTE